MTADNRHEMIGKRYGRLVVLSVSNSKRMVFCECDCGTKQDQLAKTMKRGIAKSCGCLGRENRQTSRTTHGASKQIPDPRLKLTYKSWESMKTRCSCEKNDNYKYYGGKGVTVCERWLHSFENFLADMGLRPDIDHQIDREDSNGNYEPANCRWIHQAENKRRRLINNA